MPNYERRKMVVANEANCAQFRIFIKIQILFFSKFNFFFKIRIFSSLFKIPQATPGILFSIDIFESFPTGRSLMAERLKSRGPLKF